MQMHWSRAIRSVAVLEAAKGALVLLTGFGVLALLHRNVHTLAVELLTHAHLNPASHYPAIFLDAVAHVTDARLWLYAFGALAYSVLRFLEAYGLWHTRTWAEWLAAVSGGIYVPIEIADLIKAPSWLGAGVLLVNLLVVGLMLQSVRMQHAAHAKTGDGSA